MKKGKLLGCLVFARGIEANLEKIAVIINMKPPTTTKQVQKLTGRLPTLNRFIARSAKKGLPFLQNPPEHWTFWVGAGAAASFWRTQDLFDQTNNTVQTFIVGHLAIIPSSFANHCKCSTGRREGAWKQNEAVSHILCLRSPIGSETELLRVGKDSIHSGNGLKKTEALLPSSSNQGPINTAPRSTILK